MKYPKISSQKHREINVPKLSGGLNWRECLTGIRDNQMTDCVNMWYKDGMLKTRPNFHSNENMVGLMLGNSGYKLSDKKVHYDIKYNGSVLISYKLEFIDGSNSIKIYFAWQNREKQVSVGCIDQKQNCDYFVVEKGGIIYCYLSNGSIYTSNYKDDNKIWEEVNKSDYYIPTVMAHCKAINNGLAYKGTMFEGYNLLTDSYKMIYSAVNLEDIEDGVTWMRYPYISKIPDGVEATIIARLTTKNGTVCEHKAVWTGGKEIRCYEKTDKKPEDGLYLYVTGYHFHFVTEQGTSNIATLKKEDYVEDNLEVQVIFSTTKEESKLKKVFSMTKSVWFGGAANGINGGSRLFLCGNTEENEGALVLWSALNNPLYFNENNYVYVGNKAQSVTAFGRQGDKLIIFKANEIYYSYYAANNSIDAENVINQTIVDYEANSVIFPVVSLSCDVGCDCADTIELCHNRLVWLNSNGRVYTLTSANQYSEMTVYSVSEMIDENLKKYSKEQLINAISQDFDGYYMLIINSEAYLMDYNSYGYTHIYSYSKSEDANLLIPWYYWKLLQQEFFIGGGIPRYFAIDDCIIAIYENKPTNSYILNYSVLNVGNNSGADEFISYTEDKNLVVKTNIINSMVKTKMFDFFATGYLKNIDRVTVGLGNNAGVPIKLSFMTDKGYGCDEITLSANATNKFDEGFIVVKKFHPTLKAVRIFGLKIECNGLLILDGLNIKYRLLGGIK